MRRIIAIVAVVVSFSAMSSHAFAPGAVAGTIELTPPSCAEGALKMTVASASDRGSTWISVRPASVAVACPAPVYGVTYGFVDRWNPDTGGCMDSVTHNGMKLCLGPVHVRLALVSTPAALCFPSACWYGIAKVTRAYI